MKLVTRHLDFAGTETRISISQITGEPPQKSKVSLPGSRSLVREPSWSQTEPLERSKSNGRVDDESALI
jgi:hypothetical protein